MLLMALAKTMLLYILDIFDLFHESNKYFRHVDSIHTTFFSVLIFNKSCYVHCEHREPEPYMLFHILNAFIYFKYCSRTKSGVLRKGLLVGCNTDQQYDV